MLTCTCSRLITLEHADRASHGEDAAAAARHDNSWRASASTCYRELVLGAAGLRKSKSCAARDDAHKICAVQRSLLLVVHSRSCARHVRTLEHTVLPLVAQEAACRLVRVGFETA
jgi:hypothetical protein